MNRVLIAFLALSAGLYAQDFRATLLGVVTDPTGAAVPNATVRVVNTDTQETKQAKTNTEGHYTIPYLNPGTYNVDVTATGFATLKHENIVLHVSDKIELPLQLTIGATATEITVTGQQEILDTTDASRGLVFDSTKTQELPLNGRQEYMLMSLTPGVRFTQEQFGAGGYSGTRGWDVSNAYKINGARPGTNVFLLNGTRISDNGGTWTIAPNIETVQEFKVMTNTFDAQYGGFSGGAVNTTVKSGTNQYHGDVFDYFRNSYMDANNFANNANGQPVPFHNQHQFGGIFGGPIRKDKDYFFFGFEGWREVLPAPATDTVPTAAMKQGDFAQNGYTIYDPLTSVPCNTVAGCSGHTFVRSPFPGSMIPQNRISPVALKILAFYPDPTNSLLSNNFNAPNVKDQYMYNQPTVRIDHNFDLNTRLYGLFNWQHGTENRDGTGFGGPAANGNINNARTDQNYMTNFTRILSASSVFDVRLSYGRFTSNQPGWGDPNYKGTNLGISGNCAPTIPTCAAPAINPSSFTEIFGNGNVLINWYSFNTYDLTPTFTLNRSRHTLRIGGEILYQARPSQGSGYAAGLFNFSSGWTQHYDNTQANAFDGNSIASLMLGYPSSGQVDYNPTVYITRPFYAAYVQDDWKVNNRLTVNIGMRYELQVPWMERYNRAMYGFDFSDVNPFSGAVLTNWNKLAAQYNANNPAVPYPTAPANLYGGITYLGQNGNSRRAYVMDKTDWAPRLGIAYRIDKKTVLRSGVGVFYQQQSYNLNSQYGYSLTTPYNTSLDGGQTPSSGTNLTGPNSLANPFPLGVFPPYGNAYGMETQVGNSVGFNNPNSRTPRTYQYTFGFERELPAQINLEVSYAGNKVIFVPVSYNMAGTANSLAQLGQFYSNNNLPNTQFPNPFLGVLPTSFGTLATNSTVSYQQLTRNWPLFTGLTQNFIQVGHYRSDMLQVKAERRVYGTEKGGVLTFVLAYTWGKQMQEDHRQDNWNANEPLTWEIDDQTQAHSLALSGVWDPPVGRNRHFLNSTNPFISHLVSDWRIDYILTYNTGIPLGQIGAYNYCGQWTANGVTFADGTTGQSAAHWFNNNKSCYASEASYILNPYPDRFSFLFEPTAPQLNIAAQKVIRVKERYSVLLRAESFNATNTAIRGNPSTSFTNTLFGVLPNTQKNFPRTLQLGGKIVF